MTLDVPFIRESLDNVTQHLTNNFQSLAGQNYSSVCYRPTPSSISPSNPLSTALLPSPPCFTVQTSSSRSLIQTLTFVPGAREEFTTTLTKHVKFLPDEAGVRFEVEGREIETIGQMKSGKWIAYAARALVVRFWDLAKVRVIYT